MKEEYDFSKIKAIKNPYAKILKKQKRIQPQKNISKSHYKDWVDAMWKKGYTHPITQIQEKLGVSQSFVRKNILNKIPYVVYDFRYSYGPKILKKCKTCINKEEFINFLKNEAKYSRQTEFIDLYYYLSPYKKLALNGLKMAKNNKARTGLKMNKGMLSEELIKYINENLVLVKKIKNYPCYKRKNIPEIEVEPINILNLKPEDYYRIGKDKSAEEYYREAFLNGDTKMRLGNKLTIFIKNNRNTKGMKIPFLVPYNYSLRVLGNKKKK